jgi:hypothetical protein
MKHLMTLLALLVVWSSMAQRSKSKTEDIQPVIISQGIPYSLPRSGVRVVVEATRTDFIPGPFAQYAETMLGIKGAMTQPQSFWEISRVTFQSFQEPDPDCYFMTGPGKSPLIQMTPDGCLAGFNSTPQEAKFKPPVSNSFENASTNPAIRFIGTVSNPGQSGDGPLRERAYQSAGLILKSRSARYDIAAGMLDEFHPDGKAYEESIEELERIEKKNLELFTGKAASEKNTFVFDYIPPSKTIGGEVLFRFDEKLGFLPKDDFSGKPVMLEVVKDESVPVKMESTLPAVETGSKTGIFFRHPGFGNIRLMKELTLLGTARMEIAQFGIVFPVPEELLNGNYAIELHPETGAIKSILKK